MQNTKKSSLFFSILFIFIGWAHSSFAQEDLLESLKQQQDSSAVNPVEATFKGTRLINGHSVEMRSANTLDVIISHRFGRLNGGAYELFGLDESNVRIGADYGITDRLNVGLGRNSFQKTYDGFAKYKILQQTEGARKVPVSIVGFASVAVNTLKSLAPERDLSLSNRLTYTYQALFARKFNSKFSLQLMPTVVHQNLVLAEEDDNTIFAVGIGGRYKLAKRIALNWEYYYQANPNQEAYTYNPIAIGFDIETGGHVFQLHFTNSRAMNEKGFITQTTDNFFDGDIRFGFNISRIFYFGGNKE